MDLKLAFVWPYWMDDIVSHRQEASSTSARLFVVVFLCLFHGVSLFLHVNFNIQLFDVAWPLCACKTRGLVWSVRSAQTPCMFIRDPPQGPQRTKILLVFVYGC